MKYLLRAAILVAVFLIMFMFSACDIIAGSSQPASNANSLSAPSNTSNVTGGGSVLAPPAPPLGYWVNPDLDVNTDELKLPEGSQLIWQDPLYNPNVAYIDDAGNQVGWDDLIQPDTLTKVTIAGSEVNIDVFFANNRFDRDAWMKMGGKYIPMDEAMDNVRAQDTDNPCLSRYSKEPLPMARDSAAAHIIAKHIQFKEPAKVPVAIYGLMGTQEVVYIYSYQSLYNPQTNISHQNYLAGVRHYGVSPRNNCPYWAAGHLVSRFSNETQTMLPLNVLQMAMGPDGLPKLEPEFYNYLVGYKIPEAWTYPTHQFNLNNLFPGQFR